VAASATANLNDILYSPMLPARFSQALKISIGTGKRTGFRIDF
jgi:hypothetical protein